MAPCRNGNLSTITANINLATIEVTALIDSGATTSCCGYQWDMKNKIQIGALLPDDTTVIGVGNLPIHVTGRTQPIPLKWKGAQAAVSLLVIPTLVGTELILGMDILSLLGVKIDTQQRTAEPTVVPTYIQPLRTWRIPGRTSVVFNVKNPFEHTKQAVLFEPSLLLPDRIRSTPTVGTGPELYIRLENFDEEEQQLSPEWVIGNVEVVEERRNIVKTKEEVSFPELPDNLTPVQLRQLQMLLNKYSDLFEKKYIYMPTMEVARRKKKLELH